MKTNISQIKTGVLAWCFLAFLPVFLYAVPARSVWQWMKCADGTMVEVRLVGDEHHHYYMTREQRAMRLDGNNLLVEANEAHAVPRRRAPMRAVGRVNPETFRGTRRQLVILVEYADRKMLDHSTTDFWNRLFNEQGFTAHGDYHDPNSPYANIDVAYGSVHDYFYDQSYGVFDVRFDVHRTTVAHNYAYYGANTSGGDDMRPGELVSEAVKNIASEVADWSVYDWNGDHEVEQVVVIFAGRGENDTYKTSDDNAIWSHQWTLSSAGASALQYDGYTINTYCCTSELDGTYEYGSFGTLCHEYSHCFGLPDLYNTSTGNTVLSEWDLLDSGNYAGNGFRPVGYSAYEREVMGWIASEPLYNYDIKTAIPALCDASVAFRVSSEATPNEYYMIENRQFKGWDRYLPGNGVLITHVNYDGTAWLFNTVNTSSRRNVQIIAANNSSHNLSGWAYPYADNDSLTDHSIPAATLYNANGDGSLLLHQPISNIKVDNGLASFTFGINPSTGIDAVDWRDADKRTMPIYDLQGRYLGTDWSLLSRGIYIINGKKVSKP